MQNLKSLPRYQFVTVNFKQKLKILRTNIIMFEGHKNYTLIHLSNGAKKLFARTLCHFEKQVTDTTFIRCHRAYLINSDFITGYDEENKNLYLQNNITVKISRRKFEKLGNFWK